MKTNINNENRPLEELGITNASPLKVPEGYFEELTARIMQQIPAEETSEPTAAEENKARVVSITGGKSRKHPFVRWAAAAAACIALAFVGVHYMGGSDDHLLASSESNVALSEEYDEEYAEELLSYSMVSEADVYNYLSGSEY